MKKLIIVESPHKAKTIQKYLGNEALVLASKGHVCDLPQHNLAIDVEHGFLPEYEVTPEKEETIKKLTAAKEKYDVVYLATDPDREGEAISWHLKNQLGINDGKVRIEFNEISQKAVLDAMEHPREIDMKLVDSQQARRVLDRLVGYMLSPIISRKIRKGLSVGRVQSAALKMIVDRENEIRNFKPEEYWTMAALLYKKGDKHTKANLVKAYLNDYAGEKVKVENQTLAEEIASLMPTANYYVDTVKKGTATSKPQPPFTTSTMQQEASHKLNMTADRSMRVAQQLYEGVVIEGEGQHALITYIRTDSVRVSPDFAKHALYYISQNYGKEYAPFKQNVYQTSESAQDAHEAIRPISLERTPQSLEGKIDKDAYRLYKLIYERFLASQMTNAVFNTMNVHVTAKTGAKDIGFTVKGRSVKFKGYTAVYSATVDNGNKDDEKEELDTLPDLSEGDQFDFENIVKEQKFTKPPARYNDATLVKGMEENGIGRPSTYASIISVLAKREYTEKQGKSIAPTELGEKACRFMEYNFPSIMNLSFTARLEGKLDEIAEGNEEWQDLVGKYYPVLEKYVHGKVIIPPEKQETSENGEPVSENNDDDKDAVICDKCGAKMVVKESRNGGKFYACPNYPKCKNTKPIVEKCGVCPKCGADLSKKYSKAGKVFYGCTNYPKCDFTTWDVPAPYNCPDCGSFMRQTTRNYKKAYACINKECKHVEIIEE